MDFANRTQPQAGAQPAAGAAGASRRNNNANNGRLGRVGVVVAAVVAAIVLLAIIAIAASGNNAKKESSFVDTTKLQAVFLNTGQVYFGNVKALNGKYIELTNIYYLQTSNSGSGQQANANTNVSLVKLGCELHEPYDKMIINQNSVTFWENLQDGGQVAKAVSTFEKQNPNGQKCADQSSAANNASTNSAQPANNGSGTPTTNTNKTNP